MVKICGGFLKPYFRTTVRTGYSTVRLYKMYVNLGILTYIAKWDVPCLVAVGQRMNEIRRCGFLVTDSESLTQYSTTFLALLFYRRG